jgi:lipoate---protein ligase
MSESGPWQLLPPSSVTAEVAVQRGMALLDGAAAGDPVTVAWWAVEADTLVLGRGSRIAEDPAACRRAGVPVVRRASGGGPVLWGPGLLALDVVVPKGHPLYADDVVDSYRWLGEALATAIRALGLDATAVSPAVARAADRSMGEFACYASLSAWEVTVAGRKIVGLSQVRRRGGLLLQAGIVLSAQVETLPGLLALDAETRALVTAALATRATCLADHTKIARSEVVDAVDAVLETGIPAP